MEEDIKILEKLLKEYKGSGRITYFVDLDDIQAIEHLIARNKELEKQMGKDLDVVYIKGVYDERDKWKSKIKEILNKINEDIRINDIKRTNATRTTEMEETFKIKYSAETVRNVLQELLD